MPTVKKGKCFYRDGGRGRDSVAVLRVRFLVHPVYHFRRDKGDADNLVLLVKAHDPDTLRAPADDPEFGDRRPDDDTGSGHGNDLVAVGYRTRLDDHRVAFKLHVPDTHRAPSMPAEL